MIIFPAIDLYEGKAVRLVKGDYGRMTVYSDRPWQIGADFAACGAQAIHIVDLEGARDGGTPNFDTVKRIREESGLFCEIGGGIRSMEVIDRYLSAGIDRVILGTAAIADRKLLTKAAASYGGRIAVGADLRDGFVAVKGWLETSGVSADDFFAQMQELGIGTVICTDISRDGAMRGANLALYRSLSDIYSMNITASGGVSTMDDIRQLAAMGLYGAIIGKAYYEGAIPLAEAIKVAGC